MTRAGLALLGAWSLGCAGIPTDPAARRQLEGDLEAFDALCAAVRAHPGHDLAADDPATPPPLAASMRALGVSAARQRYRDWPEGVLLEIHVSGLAVSGSATGLWCGGEPPGTLVPDSRDAMFGQPHGFVCAPARPGWFVCRDWT